MSEWKRCEIHHYYAPEVCPYCTGKAEFKGCPVCGEKNSELVSLREKLADAKKLIGAYKQWLDSDAARMSVRKDAEYSVIHKADLLLLKKLTDACISRLHASGDVNP